MAKRKKAKQAQDTGIGIEGMIAIVLLFTGFWIYQIHRSWQPLIFYGFFVGTVLIVSIDWLIQQRQKRLLQKDLLQLTPTEFEQRIQRLLQDLGWKNVQHIGGSGDRGVDLLATLNNETWVVQCKRYKDKVIPEKVREMVGTLTIQNAQRALLVTSGRFTDQARQEIRQQPVELWDKETLVEKIREADERTSPKKRQYRIYRLIFMGCMIVVNAIVALWIWVRFY